MYFLLEKARTDLSPACSVKVRHIEQARSNLCHLGSACSFHLVRPTHLVNKRGAHEKARPTLPCRFSRSIQYVSLNPRANTTRFCSLPAQLKPVTSNKRDPICALPAQSKWSRLRPECPVKVDCVIVLSNRTNFIAPHERFGPQD